MLPLGSSPSRVSGRAREKLIAGNQVLDSSMPEQLLPLQQSNAMGWHYHHSRIRRFWFHLHSISFLDCKSTCASSSSLRLHSMHCGKMQDEGFCEFVRALPVSKKFREAYSDVLTRCNTTRRIVSLGVTKKKRARERALVIGEHQSAINTLQYRAVVASSR